MKTSPKPTLYVALIIALAMLAQTRASSAQSSEEPASEAAGAPDQPANPAASPPPSDAPEPDRPEPDTDEEPASSAQSSEEAEPEGADHYLARGLAHYRAREFEKAIKAFHAGYKIDSRPEFLFALGQAERRSGDCISALGYYRRFLDTEPPARQEQAARMHMRSCEKALVSGPVIQKTQPEGAPRRAIERASRKAAPVRKRPVAVAVIPPPQPSPWYHDTAGGVLLSTGAVAVLTGAGFLVASAAAEDRATWAATYPEYDLDIARARRYQLWGAAAMGAGSVLIAGAIYRYHSRSRRLSTEAREIGISPSAGGLTISYGGRF
jgi:tetratricopeptide (TPR) repeat protein